MSESISIVALLIAISAMGVSYLTFWFDWRKRFKLACTLRGWIWYPRIEGRDDTPLSLILTLVLQNEGARPGMIKAAYVNLLSREEPQREYRLEALQTVDTNLVVQLAREEDEVEKSKAMLGVGGFVQLGKYEMRELGIHFTWAPEDARRYHLFAHPSTLKPGNYTLELWCCVEDAWGRYARADAITIIPEMLISTDAGVPVISLYGGIYDTAPGAPLAPSQN